MPKTEGKIGKTINRIFWVFLIISAMLGLGRIFLLKPATQIQAEPGLALKRSVLNPVDWGQFDPDTGKSMLAARIKAQEEAVKGIDQWLAQTGKRMDQAFFGWYFGYFTQQKFSLLALVYQVGHWLDGDNPPAAQKIRENIEEEISNRVIRPQIAQMEIEKIVNQVVAVYTAHLPQHVKDIPHEYRLEKIDWQRYAGDIATLVSQVEANRQVPIGTKGIAGAVTGSLLWTTGKLTAREGSKSILRAAGHFLGPIVVVGIVGWDILDHYFTRQKAQSTLKQNIGDYFKAIKESLLFDPQYGIMTNIYQLEQAVVPQLAQ